MFQSQINISDQTIQDNVINELQGFKNTLDESNNVNLLKIYTDIFNDQKNSLININDLVRINYAQGAILDDLANDYGVSRVDNDDEFLRFLLRWSILKSKTATTINGLKSLVANLLNINIKTFDVIATGNVEEIEIINIPFDFDSNKHSELKRTILSNAIQEVLPVEYNLRNIQFSKKDILEYFYAISSSKTIKRVTDTAPYGLTREVSHHYEITTAKTIKRGN